MQKQIICVVCPMGCTIEVTGENGEVISIKGEGCKRGVEYAQNEFLLPVRILTSSVKIENGKSKLLPVRSSKPVPKDKLFECMKDIKAATISAPVEMHQAIIKNIADTGVDIISCTEAEGIDL